MTEIPKLRRGKTYRLTWHGGYQRPDGMGWANAPREGYVECKPRTEILVVRGSFVSIADKVIYQVGTPGRRGTEALGHEDLISVEEVTA